VRPRITLAGPILRANVRAYAALGSPIAAVVKNDGYGWGAARVAREIDDLVESYVVADEAEFWALRMRTRRPIRAGPNHGATVTDITGLNTRGDQGAIGGAAEIGRRDPTEACERQRRAGAQHELTPGQRGPAAGRFCHVGAPSSNHDERCPPSLTLRRRFFERRLTVLRRPRDYCFHLQMAPDLQGQTSIRVSMAWASSGLR